MNVLGVNAGYARPQEATPDGLRHPLSDGSAALLVDGHLVFAGIEERHTRKRYAGGFVSVVHAFWDNEVSTHIGKVDTVAISSCCGPKWAPEPTVTEEVQSHLPPGIWIDREGQRPRLLVVDHHDSHASLGFVMSGAERALVAVIDGFGNLAAGSTWNAHEWWRGAFDRHSYYIAERRGVGFGLCRISVDAEGVDDVGIGEVYRALTHFCGWSSYQHAGSAMALASYGDPDHFRDVPFIRLEGGHIRCGLGNNHPRPGEVISDLLKRHGHSVPPLQGRTAAPEDQSHCDVVRAVQDQFTEALTERLTRLASDQGMDTIVVTGGSAMNCLAMGELQRSFEGRVFVPPAPSDTGQGLGNAIWAASCDSSPWFAVDKKPLCLGDPPFWGVPCSGKTLEAKAKAVHHELLVIDNETKVLQCRRAAEMLANGKLVAVSMGRSEYGPRALGRRSVLADPRDAHSSRRVNLFKKRETFRPFAPAILQEYVPDYLEWAVDSPFMSFAVKVRASARGHIPAVVHADGTARVQTVAKDSGSPLRPILEGFHSITGVPVLLNTSFNRRTEPMVETPVEAVEAFANSNIDVLLLDGITIQRREET